MSVRAPLSGVLEFVRQPFRKIRQLLERSIGNWDTPGFEEWAQVPANNSTKSDHPLVTLLLVRLGAFGTFEITILSEYLLVCGPAEFGAQLIVHDQREKRVGFPAFKAAFGIALKILPEPTRFRGGCHRIMAGARRKAAELLT